MIVASLRRVICLIANSEARCSRGTSPRAHLRQSASPGFVARRRGLRHAAARPCHARALPRLTRVGVVRPAPPVRPSLVAASRLRRMVRGRAWSSLVQNGLHASESSLCGRTGGKGEEQSTSRRLSSDRKWRRIAAPSRVPTTHGEVGEPSEASAELPAAYNTANLQPERGRMPRLHNSHTQAILAMSDFHQQ